MLPSRRSHSNLARYAVTSLRVAASWPAPEAQCDGRCTSSRTSSEPALPRGGFVATGARAHRYTQQRGVSKRVTIEYLNGASSCLGFGAHSHSILPTRMCDNLLFLTRLLFSRRHPVAILQALQTALSPEQPVTSQVNVSRYCRNVCPRFAMHLESNT